MAKLKLMKKESFKNRMTALIYGLPDSGKTRLAATLLDDPEMLPALIVVLDGSEVTLKNYVSDNLHVVQGNMEVIYDVIEICKSKSNPYKTVIFDNITQLHRTMLEKAATDSKAKQEADSRRSATDIRSEYVYQPADYGYAKNAVMRIVDTFLNPENGLSHINLIVTCWATIWTDISDPRNPKEKVELDLAGKLMTEFAGLFDVIGYLEAKPASDAENKLAFDTGKEPKVTRTLYTYKTERVPFVRNRGNKLPLKYTNPTLPGIKKLLMQD